MSAFRERQSKLAKLSFYTGQFGNLECAGTLRMPHRDLRVTRHGPQALTASSLRKEYDRAHMADLRARAGAILEILRRRAELHATRREDCWSVRVCAGGCAILARFAAQVDGAVGIGQDNSAGAAPRLDRERREVPGRRVADLFPGGAAAVRDIPASARRRNKTRL
jgi:hypothetical protein